MAADPRYKSRNPHALAAKIVTAPWISEAAANALLVSWMRDIWIYDGLYVNLGNGDCDTFHP
jgi:hypothetical protein